MARKNKIIFLALLLIVVLKYSVSIAQNRDTWTPPPFPEFNRVIIFSDPVVFYSKEDDKARLDIYIEIPVPSIIFERNPATKIFESSITISVNIHDLSTQTDFTKVFNEYTKYTDSEMKNEKDGSLYFLKTFYQFPGTSILDLKIRDNNANKEFSMQDTINIKDKSKNDIMFSDIMILSDYKTDSEGKKEITPLINNNAFNLKDFYIFFEIYNNIDTIISKQYSYRIKNDNYKIIAEGSFAYNLAKGTNKEFEKLDFFSREPLKYILEISDKDTGGIVAVKHFFYHPASNGQRRPPPERHRQGF